MKNLALILLTALGLVSVTAQAHTALSASKPANEEVVTVPLRYSWLWVPNIHVSRFH